MNNRTLFGFFLLFWVLQSVITAWQTELYSDEAYYWMYAQFLDWGYFDHPPGVAVMIWLGNFLGRNELAVRVFNILLMAGALAIIYATVKPKNVLIFCLTLFSFLTLHLSGFVALPDTPFFFFALVFMLAYRGFLRSASGWYTVALGASAAAMLYSKYHGVLVILFVILSNPRLLTKYRFYLAGGAGVLLFLPHILWQIQHEFPSLQYHLVDRGSSYKLSQTLDYVFGNVPFHGGLVSVALLVASFRYRAADIWEKALQWNLYGTLVFFLLITFKGQYIEPNWTIFCIFPLLYLGYRGVENASWFPAYRVTAVVFAGVLLLLKIHLIHPLVNIKKDRVWEFHLSESFAQTVDRLSEGEIIVANDYQSASLLNFYAPQPYYIPALNINSRANQYSLWRLDTLLCDRDIAYVNRHLDGIAVEGRMHKTQNVTKLTHVTSPNLLTLQKGTAAADQDTVRLSLEIVLPTNPTCQYEDTLSLEITLLRSGTPVLTRQEPFSTAGDRAFRRNYRLPAREVDQVMVRVLSAKLGGGTNQSLKIEVQKDQR